MSRNPIELVDRSCVNLMQGIVNAMNRRGIHAARVFRCLMEAWAAVYLISMVCSILADDRHPLVAQVIFAILWTSMNYLCFRLLYREFRRIEQDVDNGKDAQSRSMGFASPLGFSLRLLLAYVPILFSPIDVILFYQAEPSVLRQVAHLATGLSTVLQVITTLALACIFSPPARKQTRRRLAWTGA